MNRVTTEPMQALLNSLARDYPWGIPKHVELKPQPVCLALVYVSSGSAEADKTLLDGAITKGMKLKKDAVELCIIKEGDTLNLDSLAAPFVLFLGNEAWSAIEEKMVMPIPGVCLEVNGKHFMLSRSLTSILSDQDSKRAFWNDLKTVMGMIK